MSSPDLHTQDSAVINLADRRAQDAAPAVPPEIYDDLLELLDGVSESVERGEVGSLVIAAVSPDGETTDHSYIVDLKIPNQITAELRGIADELHDRYRDRAFYVEEEIE